MWQCSLLAAMPCVQSSAASHCSGAWPAVEEKMMKAGWSTHVPWALLQLRPRVRPATLQSRAGEGRRIRLAGPIVAAAVKISLASLAPAAS